MNLIHDYYQLPFEDRDFFLINLEFEEMEERWDLFINILDNPDFDDPNYDLVAIRVLKILEISQVPKNQMNSIVNLLIKIIKNTTDDDIRNYAFIASKNFIENEDLQKVIESFLKSKTEDPILKFNALNALGQIESPSEKKKILIPFENDKDIGKYVSEFL